jgi:hypothetical protein
MDRGSRQPEVREELEDLCTIVKTKAGCYYTNYCFLEVVPPFIEEGIKKCQENGADSITDFNEALTKYPFNNRFMTSHLGVDQKLIDLLIERARSVEEKRFGFS